jgi:beta-glucosidase
MKKLFVAMVAMSMMVLTSCKNNASGNYEYPFQNPNLSTEKRVDNIISLLTPDEKIGLMMNGSISVERLGIPAYNWWSEACHGICTSGATVFPQAIGLAATFDQDMQYDIYTMVSDEARAHWNITNHNQMDKTEATGGIWNQGLSFWCPNINIFRDPRWGRGQETYGEDPFLTGTMGSATVRGMQGNDKRYLKTHSCAKHYAVHSGPESSRHRDDIYVSMRDLWETYLPAFKELVTEADVQEVMCAYNRYEGEPCCGSDRLLVDILRNKWEYKHLVVSDCGAINNFYTKGQHETHPDAATASVDGVLSGTDIECGTSYKALKTALSDGLIKESDLDVSLRRIFTSRFELGLHDPESMDPWASLGAETMSSPEHTAMAQRAAREAMVLLKNDGILPLSKNTKTIAVVGPNADNAGMQNGNYSGTPTAENTLSILNALKKAVPGANIIYEKGCELADPYLTLDHMADLNGGKGLHGEYFNNTTMSGAPVATADYTNLNLRTSGDYRFAPGVEMTNFSARYTGTFIADFTGDMNYSIRGNDTWKFTVNGKTVAEQKEPTNMRYGRGQVPQTSFPVVKGRTYTVAIDFTKGETGTAYFAFNLSQRKLPDYNEIAAKVAGADVIIMVGGLSAQLEGEEMQVVYDGFSGGDRTKIELPEPQVKLLQAVHSTGKPVVFVNCTGSAIGFGAIENQYNALLQAWYGGQAAGIAVADILFGDYNPAGRLPVTFYASTSQLPDFKDYSMENRTYRYFTGKPLYAFGYGLSYTSFTYGDAKLSKNSVKAGKGVDITIPVTNSGKLDGDEVIQVYVKSLDNPDAPIKALKGFKRVNIAAGSTASVKITLEPDAFAYYSAAIDELAPRAGKYQILYGSSSRDEDLKTLDFQVL